MKFLFWNINKKPLINEITELIIESKCHIAAFAEVDDNSIQQIIKKLNEDSNIKECCFYETPGCDRLKIIVIGSNQRLFLLKQNSYYSLIKITGKHTNAIIGFVHFPSKLHCSTEALTNLLHKFREDIVVEESLHSIQHSVLIGDFNISPFESPMISFYGMGASNGIECSQRSPSIYQESNKLFYNPMWILYARYNERPGSYHYLKTDINVLTWHFLDQVIIRPSLIEFFNFDSLTLMTGTKNFDYTNRNNKPKISDHLPLICEIEF